MDPVAEGMKAVSELVQVGALELKATLKALLEARKRSGQFWTFQLMMVPDGTVDRWFFRHSAALEELERRFLITETSCSSGTQAS